MASLGTSRAFTALEDPPSSTDAPQDMAPSSPTARHSALQQTPQTKKITSNIAAGWKYGVKKGAGGVKTGGGVTATYSGGGEVQSFQAMQSTDTTAGRREGKGTPGDEEAENVDPTIPHINDDGGLINDDPKEMEVGGYEDVASDAEVQLSDAEPEEAEMDKDDEPDVSEFDYYLKNKPMTDANKRNLKTNQYTIEELTSLMYRFNKDVRDLETRMSTSGFVQKMIDKTFPPESERVRDKTQLKEIATEIAVAIKKKMGMHVSDKDKESLCKVLKDTIDHYCNLSAEIKITSKLRDEVTEMWNTANIEYEEKQAAELKRAQEQRRQEIENKANGLPVNGKGKAVKAEVKSVKTEVKAVKQITQKKRKAVARD